MKTILFEENKLFIFFIYMKPCKSLQIFHSQIKIKQDYKYPEIKQDKIENQKIEIYIYIQKRVKAEIKNIKAKESSEM